MQQPTSRRTRQRGVGLIEVLIAVLVMAIGLLGVAALQAAALRNSQSSLERSQAVVLSYAILDAMRANVVEARAGRYDMGMCADAGKPGADAAGGEQLRTADRSAWLAALRAELGAEACAQVRCTAVAGTDAKDCAVTVRWDDARGTGGSTRQQIRTVARV
jgi:type IV pilus assembly protein PilV